jgi:hypothetical protein
VIQKAQRSSDIRELQALPELPRSIVTNQLPLDQWWLNVRIVLNRFADSLGTQKQSYATIASPVKYVTVDVNGNVGVSDIPSVTYPVTSVAGKTGDVTLSYTDIQKFEEGVMYLINVNRYVLPKATRTTLGGVKIGDSLTISSDGVLNVVSTSSDSRYEFFQSTPAASWSVNHNLGKYPSVSVVELGSKEVVFGNVTYLSTNSVQIDFASPFSGYAYMN